MTNQLQSRSYNYDDNSVFNRFWSQMIFMPSFEEDVGSSSSRQAAKEVQNWVSTYVLN